MIKKLLLTVFLVVNFFFANTVFGQAVGDYRSNGATGNWTTLSSWQYYNGSTWVTPSGTTPQGYPGQFTGTGAVLIQAGNTMTIGTANLTTQNFGTLTINGALILDGGGSGAVFTLNTLNIIVTADLTPYANISFANKVTLALPLDANIQVGTGGLPSPGNGTCNNNITISIGGITYAYCTGGGSAANDFNDIMSLGGTGSATSNTPVCVSNTINLSATPPPKGGPFNYSWTGPNGFSANSQNSTLTAISTSGGIYSVIMTSTTLSPNQSIAAQTTVVVNPSMSTTPTVASATAQPTCTVATGTITVSAPTGSGMKYSINGLTYTNTSGVFSSLSPGTYNVTAKNSSGCISNATSVTIKGATNIWNGSAWSNITEPIITENIEFAGTYSENKDVVGCSCQVNNAVFVTISANRTLTLTNGLNVIGSGTLAFIDSASLLQSNTASNINFGYIYYNRSTFARQTDYTYWSSPVSPMSLGELVYPLNGTYYSYEATSTGEGWKQEGSGTDMAAGIGYIANRGAAIPLPAPAPPPSITALNVTFSGVPNNGSYPISVFKDKSSLLGNPYPSAIDANTFLNENTGVLFGTLYFWTHNTAIQDATNITDGTAGSGAFAYTSNDYATYNATGGVAATQPDKDLLGNPYPSTVPSGNIAAGQGFFATAKSTGTVMFNNNIRIAGNNTQFFKSRSPKVKTSIEKNRIWLNLTNTQGAFKQTLVGYITDATNDYDDRFDGESFDGNEFVDFYSVNQDKNLTIQGRALPFDENDEVPLGYRTTINGDFTINIDQVDGSLTNQAVFIEDKLTNTVTDLKSGNYTFNTVAGTFNDRFVLRYKDNSTAKTLATANFDSQANKVLVSNKNKQIKINSFAETIDKVMIYDVLGKQIYQKDKVNSNELSIANLVSSRQTLIVKTVLQNGSTVTDKIIY